MKALYAQKLGMTRIFKEDGTVVPVTVLLCQPNIITQVKTPANDGYSAIQVGFGTQKLQRVNKPRKGHLEKAKKGTPRILKEIRLDRQIGTKVAPTDSVQFEVGGELPLGEMFSIGSKVDVVGISIGKGFAGVMKRHHMKGAQTNTHGTHEYFRHGGSIGCRKFPGRVFKNKRMGGHMGAERVMQEHLEVVSVRAEENVLLLKGSVPGAKNSYVFIRASEKINQANG